MLQYEELILEFEGLKPQLKELAAALDLENLKAEITKLEEESAQPDFWNDSENSQKTLQRMGGLKAKVSQYEKLAENFDDVITMAELANEEDDESMLEEIMELADKAKELLVELGIVWFEAGYGYDDDWAAIRCVLQFALD